MSTMRTREKLPLELKKRFPWLQQMENYVDMWLPHGGFPEHVDANEVYKTLARSVAVAPGDHAAVRSLKAGLLNLADWMSTCTSQEVEAWYEYESDEDRDDRIPGIGGSPCSAIMAVCCIVPQEEGPPVVIQELLEKTGLSFLLRPPREQRYAAGQFWEGAAWYDEDWRREYVRLPGKILSIRDVPEEDLNVFFKGAKMPEPEPEPTPVEPAPNLDSSPAPAPAPVPTHGRSTLKRRIDSIEEQESPSLLLTRMEEGLEPGPARLIKRVKKSKDQDQTHTEPTTYNPPRKSRNHLGLTIQLPPSPPRLSSSYMDGSKATPLPIAYRPITNTPNLISPWLSDYNGLFVSPTVETLVVERLCPKIPENHRGEIVRMINNIPIGIWGSSDDRAIASWCRNVRYEDSWDWDWRVIVGTLRLILFKGGFLDIIGGKAKAESQGGGGDDDKRHFVLREEDLEYRIF